MLTILAHLLFIGWPLSNNSEAKQNIHEIFEQTTDYYSVYSLDSAKLLAQVALSESKKISYSYGVGRSLFFLGALASREGKTSVAIPQLLEALEQLSISDNKKALFFKAEICVTLGKIFRQHYSITEAITFYEQGINFALASNNKRALRSLLYNQSIAYRRKGDLIRSVDVLTQSMDLIPNNDKIIKQRTYNQFGLINRDLQEYQEARHWYQQMIDLDTLKPSRYKGQACHNTATTYREQNINSKAKEYYEKALSSFENYGTPKDLFLTYHDMAELALFEGNHVQAFAFGQEALGRITQLPNTPDYFKIYKLLAECKTYQNPSQAIAYANQFMKASEAFNNQQKELLANGDKYKVQLIASTYFNKVKREKQRLKVAWTMSCAAVFVFLAIALSLKLYRIYSYRSPKLALSHIKNQNEMIYLLDLFRNEKEEMKNTLKQGK